LAIVWRLLALVKASIALSTPSATADGISNTSQLSKTKPKTGSGVIDGVTVGEGVADGVAVKVAVALAVGLGVELGIAVGEGVAVAAGVSLGASVGEGVTVGKLVAVGKGVAVGWLKALHAHSSIAIVIMTARRLAVLENIVRNEANTEHQLMRENECSLRGRL